MSVAGEIIDLSFPVLNFENFNRLIFIFGELITGLDVWINTKVMVFWNPLLNKVMIFVTNIASPAGLLVLSLILLGALVYRKKWLYSLLLFLGMSGGLFFELLIKKIIQRARPGNALLEVSGYSFPSGHATMAIIFFSLLIYSFKDEIRNKVLRRVFIVGSVFIFLFIGLSRVYLNVHWFSDVLAGFGLGMFWLTFLILAFKVAISLLRRTRRRSNKL